MEIFTTFFERVKPDSTNVNPACIKKIRIPERKIHNIVRSSLTSTAVVALKSELLDIVNNINSFQKYTIYIFTIKKMGYEYSFLLF